MTRPPRPQIELVLEVPADFTLPECGRRTSCAELLRAAIGRAALELLRNDPPIRRDENGAEAVHRARVALRRLRSELRTLAPIVDPAWRRETLRELRWLGATLGSVRDADVLTQRLHGHAARLSAEERRELEALMRGLEKQRAAAHDALLLVFAGDRYLALVERLLAAAQSPPLAAGNAGDRPARRLLRRRVRKAWRNLLHHVERLPAEPEPAALHETRKRAKRLHYAAELAMPCFGRDARRFARAIKRIQTALGEFQDASVAEAWLRGEEEAREARSAFVAGVCAARERARMQAARAAWPRAWKRARRKRLRRWLR